MRTPAIRVVIITGSGDKAFCAGADIGEFDFDPEKARSFLIAALEVLAAPENTRKPVISAVNGIAYGGGFELAMASDFIIASDRARFAVPEIKLGLLPGFAIVRLQDIVGRAKAKEMSMLGDPISAEEACRLGIVLRVVPHASMLADALAFAGADRVKAAARGADGQIVLQPRARRRRDASRDRRLSASLHARGRARRHRGLPRETRAQIQRQID